MLQSIRETAGSGRRIAAFVAWAVLAAVALPAAAQAQAQAQDNSIDRVAVHGESRDELVLAVEYTYSGNHGERVFLSAVMADGGEPSPYYAYGPGRVERGRHRARVTLGMNERAPDIFSTDQIRVAMYVDGGDPFLTRTFRYPKTWSRPGATLQPVLRRVPPGGPDEEIALPGGGSGGAASGAPERRILPDGSVEVRYPDGRVVRISEGRIVETRPGEPERMMLFQDAPPPTPPPAPPDSTHSVWLDHVSGRLLDILRQLVGHHEPSIQNYLEQEGPSLTPYQRIDSRAQAIQWLVQP